MKSKPQTAVDLEAELVRLNDLVRARRQQLARLERCPNKDCECRRVWREVVESDLSTQVGKIRKKVRTPNGARKKAVSPPRGGRRASARRATA